MLPAKGTGKGFIVTDVVVDAVHVPAETINVYMPFANALTGLIVGFDDTAKNPLGPVKLIVPPVAVNVNAPFKQTGELEFKTGTGKLTTVTLEVADAVQPDAVVTVTVYSPVIGRVAFAIVGFCSNEVKPNGPLHEYPVPPFAVKLIFVFKHATGLLVTITGNGLTITFVVTLFVHPAALVTDNVYTPALVACALAIIGF